MGTNERASGAHCSLNVTIYPKITWQLSVTDHNNDNDDDGEICQINAILDSYKRHSFKKKKFVSRLLFISERKFPANSYLIANMH